MEMTREEQLDFVARNYGEWPGDSFMACYNVDAGNVHFSGSKREICATDTPYFTRAEVEQRKAELQNKPDPSKLPDEANFYAQNKNGSWDWFSDKATPDNLDECWDHEGLGGFTCRRGEVIGDWRDTLEKRPEVDATDTDGGTIEPICAPDDFEDDSATLTDEGAKTETAKGRKSSSELVKKLKFSPFTLHSNEEVMRKVQGAFDALEKSAAAAFPKNGCSADNEKPNSELYPQYFKDVSGIDELDVYGVHQLFEIDDPSGAIQHASKKLLLSGVRTGGKSKYKDIKEARDTLNRWLKLNNE